MLEYERAVIFRLGQLLPGGAKGPGQIVNIIFLLYYNTVLLCQVCSLFCPVLNHIKKWTCEPSPWECRPKRYFFPSFNFLSHPALICIQLLTKDSVTVSGKKSSNWAFQQNKKQKTNEKYNQTYNWTLSAPPNRESFEMTSSLSGCSCLLQSVQRHR